MMKIIGVKTTKGEYNGTPYDKVKLFLTQDNIPAQYGCGVSTTNCSIKRSLYQATMEKLGEDPSEKGYAALIDRTVDLDYDQYQNVKGFRLDA